MTEEELKGLAQLLRKPEGEYAVTMGEKMNEGNALLHERTFEVLNVQANDSLLEIGMGNGHFVPALLAEPSVTYHGCDYSEAMVEEARNNNVALADRATFQVADVHQLPLDDGAFTKAFTINTIYFWEHPQQVLQELYRVLAPGGMLVVALRPKDEMDHYPFVQYGFTSYSEERLTDLLTTQGFEHIQFTRAAEPSQEFNGVHLTLSSLVVNAQKAMV